jgi:hypothetical protein
LIYEAIAPDHRGWLWCESLKLWLGTWRGTIVKETATWLRFYDEEGNLVLLNEELAEQEKQRAEQEKQRADQAESALQELQNRLAEMGIDLPSQNS